MAPAVASPVAAQVTLYQHCHYAGYAVELSPGAWDQGRLLAAGAANDDVSSLEVPAGYSVELFEQGDFTGRSVRLTANQDCLVGLTFNDVLSSVRVAGPATAASPPDVAPASACRCRTAAGSAPVCVSASGEERSAYPGAQGWWYVHVGGHSRRWERGTDALCCASGRGGAAAAGDPVGFGIADCLSRGSQAACQQLLVELGCVPGAGAAAGTSQQAADGSACRDDGDCNGLGACRGGRCHCRAEYEGAHCERCAGGKVNYPDCQRYDPYVFPDVASREFCWAASKPRGRVRSPSYCPPGMALEEGTCRTPCPAGTTAWGEGCLVDCPAGYRDDGLTCGKPAAYGRGTGYGYVPLFEERADARERCEEDHGGGNCERHLEMYYPRCGPGFSAFGCCLCSPSCPPGTSDLGAMCSRTAVGRASAEVACDPAAEEPGLAGTDCYPKCGDGWWNTDLAVYACFGACAADRPVPCGLGCAASPAACQGVLTNQVMAVVDLAKSMVETFAPGASGTRPLRVILREALTRAAFRRGARDLSQAALESAVEAAVTELARQTGKPEAALDILVGADPSGIVALVDAFWFEVCPAPAGG